MLQISTPACRTNVFSHCFPFRNFQTLWLVENQSSLNLPLPLWQALELCHFFTLSSLRFLSPTSLLLNLCVGIQTQCVMPWLPMQPYLFIYSFWEFCSTVCPNGRVNWDGNYLGTRGIMSCTSLILYFHQVSGIRLLNGTGAMNNCIICSWRYGESTGSLLYIL